MSDYASAGEDDLYGATMVSGRYLGLQNSIDESIIAYATNNDHTLLNASVGAFTDYTGGIAMSESVDYRPLALLPFFREPGAFDCCVVGVHSWSVVRHRGVCRRHIHCVQRRCHLFAHHLRRRE